MRIVDPKVKNNLSKYVFQSLLATVAILLPLIFLDVLNETAIIASLGATAFIVFVRPQTKFSQPRRLFGGYFVGILVGCLFCFLSQCILFHTLLGQKWSLVIFGALAVGLSIFIMVTTDTEHAPAAGIALGLVINDWDYLTLFFIVSSVILFSLVKRLLISKMIDLT